MLANLDYLRFKYTTRLFRTGKRKLYIRIDSLLAIYGNKDYSVEIIAAKLNNGFYGYGTEANMDSLKAAEYELCKETIARFPNYERIGLIKTGWPICKTRSCKSTQTILYIPEKTDSKTHISKYPADYRPHIQEFENSATDT